MKIYKIKESVKVLSLKLIKNKIYNNKINNFAILKFQLKKNFKILFKFYLSNKKILFLSNNKNFKLNNLIFKLIKDTKHAYIPSPAIFRGILTNLNIIFKYLVLSSNLNKFIKFLFNLKLKTNLIVMFNNKINNIFELLSLKIPIISFLNFNKFYDYKTNFFDIKNSINMSCFYFILNSLKKRSEILKIKKFKFQILKNKYLMVKRKPVIKDFYNRKSKNRLNKFIFLF